MALRLVRTWLPIWSQAVFDLPKELRPTYLKGRCLDHNRRERRAIHSTLKQADIRAAVSALKPQRFLREASRSARMLLRDLTEGLLRGSPPSLLLGLPSHPILMLRRLQSKALQSIV